MGGYIGALLARADNDVTFIARGAHLQAIRAKGLRVEGPSIQAFTLPVQATSDPREVGPVELVLFCVKTYHNPQAIPLLPPLVGPSTMVISLQNGVDNAEQIGEAIGMEHVLGGAVYIDTLVQEPGVILKSGAVCRVVLGEVDGRETPRAREVHRVLSAAGIEAVLARDIRRELWSKFIFICALSGVACVTRATIQEVMETRETQELFRAVLREVQAVAYASGVRLDPDIVDQVFDRTYRIRKEQVSSMQVDLEHGRPLEVEAINGAVARLGERLGVATPVNATIYAALKIADNRARAR